MVASREEMMRQMRRPRLWQRLTAGDWAWAALVALATAGTFQVLGDVMNGYEVVITLFTAGMMIGIGWHWHASKVYMAAVCSLSLFAVMRYPTLEVAQTDFFLQYLLASQSAIMWMSALFPAATLVYGISLFTGNVFTGRVASTLTWFGAGAGLVGLLVRWHETHLFAGGIGYIPVSNLYEVFVLFAVITALIYLYYEKAQQTYSMGFFVLLVITASVGFLLWYHFDRGASQIEPLVPALKSYWMKIHVPTNFIGYGCFAIAAMLGVAYLIRARVPDDSKWAQRLPTLKQIDDVSYRSIALGFAFFTVATILGALWAAEAWGAYWSWDPKETWALIVWLNYAAWLHLRYTKGLRGTPMAWWAVIGLFVTTFAFLGVNMFLSGLHSYGEL